MGQPRRPWRGSFQRNPGQGSPSLLPQLPELSWATRSLGLCGAQWGPALPTGQPAVWLWPELSRHLRMPGPNGRCWACPSLSLET